MTEIRRVEIRDLPVVQRLAHEIWPSAYGDILGGDQLNYMLDLIYSISALEHQFSELKHQFILAFDKDVPVGFASFSAQEEPAVYHLNKIYILPDQQGKHIGRRILDYVIAEIKGSGGTCLQLNVNRKNKALEFYKKLGFEIIRKVDIDIGHGYFMNDYILELKF